MQERLVVTGLELVGADEEPERFLLDTIRDKGTGEAVERRLRDLFTTILVLAREGDDGPVRTLALRKVVADRIEVLNGTLAAARPYHRPPLPANLAPREFGSAEFDGKKVKLISYGMLLASGPSEDLRLATIDGDAAPGSRLK